MPELPRFSVSQFVDTFNSTLEMAYPTIEISGEVANIRVSQNKWLYFDLKDEAASLKFFGTVWQLPGPIEDGMMLLVRGQPRLARLYGFSINIQAIKLAGEGTIKRAAELLMAKLKAEGLFEQSRKRSLPYPPQRVGLITSTQAAAYTDFVRVLNDRWQGLRVELIDVSVQGESAPAQIVSAIELFNEQAVPPDVLVLIRGGGSPEDLAAFSSEPVTRAVAASRVPTLVAVGHERDVSLAELAADKRAATPSMAAECLVPSRRLEIDWLENCHSHLQQSWISRLAQQKDLLISHKKALSDSIKSRLSEASQNISDAQRLLQAYSPAAVLNRGYAIVKLKGQVLRQARAAQIGDQIGVYLSDGKLTSQVLTIERGSDGQPAKL